jgi:hypothetical protein
MLTIAEKLSEIGFGGMQTNANTKRICNPAEDGGLKGIIVFKFDMWNFIRYYEEFHSIGGS